MSAPYLTSHCCGDLERAQHPAEVLAPVQVEITLQKSVFRVVGTAVGGVVGWAAMSSHTTATDPYALAAVLSVWVFLAAFLAPTAVRLANSYARWTT